MGLKVIYATADDIPETHKDLYSEADDGRFVLDLEDVDSHPKVRGVITANNENKKKAQARQAKLDELEAKLSEIPEDFDAEQWLAFKSGKQDDPKAKDEHQQKQRELYEQRIANLTKKHDTDIASLNEQLAERDGYIDKTTRLDVLRKALRDAGVDADFEDVVVDHLSPSIRVNRADDGSRKAFVETDLGEVSVGEFVKSWAGSKGQRFLAKASGPSAPGSERIRSSAKTMARVEFEKLDAASRHKAIVKDKIQIVD